jgi:formylglycine-generating enzyme required for sulfatase activity
MIGIEMIIIKIRPKIILQARPVVLDAWFAAAVGTVEPGSFGVPFAATTGPPIAATALASACARIVKKHWSNGVKKKMKTKQKPLRKRILAAAAITVIVAIGVLFKDQIFIGKETLKRLEEMPEDVRKIAKKIGVKKVRENDIGLWEANYGNRIIMVYIPSGEFTMGSDKGAPNEKPEHQVYLDGYWMGKYEVTMRQYKAFVSDQGYAALPYTVSKYSPSDHHPVTGVSWEDTMAYCKWLSKKTGLTFGLPTEAQWEKAARGTDGRKYPWGNNEPDETLAYFHMKIGKTSRVGSYLRGASPYGLRDMAGNVWEWCRDWYSFDYYSKSSRRNPPGSEAGSFRVLRGGGWAISAEFLCCAYRSHDRPSHRSSDLGFRLCQDK